MGQLHEEGKFRAWVREGTEPKLGESSHGTPRVEVEIEVESGDYILWDGYLSDGALDITLKSLRAMGFQGDNIEDLSTVGSKEFEIVTKFEEYKGKQYCRVKFVNDIGGGRVAMPPEKKKKFAADLRGKIRALEGAAGKAAPTPARPARPSRPAPAARTAPATGAKPEPEDPLDDLPNF
jgi:hypothetical protein